MTAPAADSGKMNQTMIPGVDHFYSVKLIHFLSVAIRPRNWEQVIPFFAFAPELRKIPLHD
jgi:hypothetical protein